LTLFATSAWPITPAQCSSCKLIRQKKPAAGGRQGSFVRFAALTSMMETGQSLACQSGVQAHSRDGVPPLPRAKRSGRFPWRLGMICLAAASLLYAFSLLN
jgi:hypothetical protein